MPVLVINVRLIAVSASNHCCLVNFEFTVWMMTGIRSPPAALWQSKPEICFYSARVCFPFLNYRHEADPFFSFDGDGNRYGGAATIQR